MLSKTRLLIAATALVVASGSAAFADQDTDVSLYRAPVASSYYGVTSPQASSVYVVPDNVRGAMAQQGSIAPHATGSGACAHADGFFRVVAPSAICAKRPALPAVLASAFVVSA